MDKKLTTQDLMRRKSVRKYTEKWDGQRTAEVMDAASGLESLIPDIGYRFFTIDGGDVMGQGKADAPCYLALYSEEKAGWMENAGFLLYQLSLLLSKNGIGSVPLSGSKPKVAPAETDGMTMVMLMSAGMPGEELYRNPLEDIRRKPLDEICGNENQKAREILEYVRISPSAGNGQPWYFGGDASRIDIYAERAGDAFNTSNTELKLLDTGMACFGMYVAAREMGCFGGFTLMEGGQETSAPKGFSYNRSMLLKQ